MQPLPTIKDAERRAYRTAFADGVWVVLLGCFVLQFSLAPLLSESLGDFWSSAIFLPFWGLVYLAIWLARRQFVAPRLGRIRFHPARRLRLRRFTRLLLRVYALALGLGLIAAFVYPKQAPFFSIILSVFVLVGFSVAAYLLEYARLYLYGLLLFIAPYIGEWLYARQAVMHHGYPLVFGLVSGAMILAGLVTFARFLKNNPALDAPV